MCSVSMVGDHYNEIFKKQVWYPQVSDPAPATAYPAQLAVSRDEFDALKREVENMKALLKRAKEYDERNGEPDCEVDEKMAVLRKVAALVGIDLDDVIGKGQRP